MPSRAIELDYLLARDLNRVREKLPLAQVDLASSSGVAQGTVSNFLQGKPVHADHAEKIVRTLATAAEQASLGLLGNEDLGTIARARAIVEGKQPTRAHRNSKVRGSPWAPSDYIALIMALTDETRFNLTKSFDYLTPEHFLAHVRCVASGVKYRWLAYETDTLEDQWREYTQELQRELKQRHLDELEEEFDKRLDEKALKALREQLVQCHVFPKVAQRPGQLIPFRITAFGKEVCLFSEERTPNSYRHGMEHFVLPASEIAEVKSALEALFDFCPAIDDHDRIAKPNKAYRKYHDQLRGAFLKALVKTIG